MLNKILSTTAAIALAFGAISTASITALTFSADSAYAGNGNGNNGNGNGNGGNNGNSGNNGNAGNNGNGNNGHGSIASALGGLNAAHANENAFANASPNSRVGKIAAYRDAALLTNELSTLAEAELAALNLLAVPTRTSADIEAEIAAAVAGTDLTLLEAELAEALTYEGALSAYEAAAAAATEQEGIETELLEAAANKGVPEGEALEALREMLGL